MADTTALAALAIEAAEHQRGSVDGPADLDALLSWLDAFQARCRAAVAAEPSARTLWDRGYEAGFEDGADNRLSQTMESEL